LQPALSLTRLQDIHHLQEIRHHGVMHLADQRRAGRGHLHENPPTIRQSIRPADVPQFLQPVHDPGRGRSGVAHARGDVRHAQRFGFAQKAEQTVWRKRDVAAGQFL